MIPAKRGVSSAAARFIHDRTIELPSLRLDLRVGALRIDDQELRTTESTE